jgi:hypothetical protein
VQQQGGHFAVQQQGGEAICHAVIFMPDIEPEGRRGAISQDHSGDGLVACMGL